MIFQTISALAYYWDTIPALCIRPGHVLEQVLLDWISVLWDLPLAEFIA